MSRIIFRFTVIFFALFLSSSLLFAGGGKEKSVAQVDAKRISPEELKAMIDGKEDFLLLDLRKAEDYEKSHIEGAVNADMDAAVYGDEEKGRETLESVLINETGSKTGEGKTLVLACYTGNRYANAALSVLGKEGRDFSDVMVLEGGNKAWDEAYGEKEELETAKEIATEGGSYSWNDTFDFSKRIGKSSLNLYDALDIMGINTPCAFETSASDVGLTGSFADRTIANLGGSDTVTEGKDGVYVIQYKNNEKACAETRWPKYSSLATLLPEISREEGKIAYSAYNDSYLVVAMEKMDREKAQEYVASLKTLFPVAAPGPWNDLMYRGSDRDGNTVSFSYGDMALALEKKN